MKYRGLLTILAGLGTFPTQGNCQVVDLLDETPIDEMVYDDAATETVDEEQNKENAADSARKLLYQKPEILSLRQNQIKSLKESVEAGKAIKEKVEDKVKEEKAKELTEEEKLEIFRSQFAAAPLGLYWGASKEDLEKLGFKLQSAERKDYKNVYQVLNPEQKNDTFRQITAIFGMQNKLWCIYAQGQLLNDDAKASQVLELYHKYYNALAAKYGNAQEHFSPYTYEEKLIKGEGEKKIVETVTRQNPLGGDNFLKELQEGKAVLYATFQNDKIGVTLGVSVDGDGKSYISIDYKDFSLLDSEQETALNKAIEDI